MGIFDIFSSNDNKQPAAPAAQPANPAAPSAQVAVPATQPAAAPASTTGPNTTTTIPDTGGKTADATPGTEVNGVVPPKPDEAKPVEEKDTSPLAEFKNLWDTPKDKDGKDIEPVNQEIVDLDPKDVATAVAKTDFSSAITPENLKAISEGGEEAQKAFASTLEAVAKQVLTQATIVSSKLATDQIKKALQTQEAKLPALLRAANASSHLRDTNPLFSDPAIAPIIDATKTQLLEKFPDATPAEITTMTHNYILAMGEAFAPKDTKTVAAGETDWTKYLEHLE